MSNQESSAPKASETSVKGGEPKSKIVMQGVLTLIGGFSLYLYVGCFLLWSNIDVYVISYFHYVNGADEFSFIYLVETLNVAAILLGYQIGTYLLQTQRWHPKVVITIGSVLSLAGNFVSSYT